MELIEKFCSPEKEFNINFSKADTKFCFSFHYDTDNIFLLANGKEIFKFKADNKNVNYTTQSCIRSLSNEFSATESRKVSLNGNKYDFSVSCNSIDESDILKIHEYLMAKNNIKNAQPY